MIIQAYQVRHLGREELLTKQQGATWRGTMEQEARAEGESVVVVIITEPNGKMLGKQTTTKTNNTLGLTPLPGL